MKRKRGAQVIGLCVMLIVACNVPLMATPVSTPTSPSTASASATPEASLMPTATAATALPSETPTLEAPSLTPTIAPVGQELDCRLIWQSPRSGVHYDPRVRFDVGWKVSNTGTTAWDPGTVEFTYAGGTKMYRSALVPLQATVNPGDSVALSAEMVTPKNSGKYTTAWSLRRGTDYFCRVSLTIFVP
jgi:hypothetical protein